MILTPTSCPTCHAKIVKDNFIRCISLLEADENGQIKAKCKRCKTWVNVPLLANSPAQSVENKVVNQ